MSPMQKTKKFGTAPVFYTAISTILGAILFLRFGYAVGTVGFWGVVLIILLGHLVTIPTALAISELATNKRVEGGGEYFIISRSFGLNIGATIGFSLFLSQAISVAFYVIAFTETFEFLFNHIGNAYNIALPRQIVSIPVMVGLGLLILKQGANLGVKALYFVVVILAASLVLFFMGQTTYQPDTLHTFGKNQLRNMNDFYFVFAIIFPAFTGMTAGVGLSGDLKSPGKSIPLGTTLATVIGMVIYLFIAYKLTTSASAYDLINNQLIMSQIAVWGFIVIPIGLAASTISSALGSIMVAPRTLQALASDSSFPFPQLNRWLSKARRSDDEPTNATLVTASIALIFVALGNVNIVAQIISMFFMVTYGSICLISFLNHFGSSPSYRPSFRSKWLISLIGFFTSVWVMFMMNLTYALVAIGVMVILYLWINNYHKNRKGLVSIFANALYQLNRNLQVYLQKERKSRTYMEWRPSAICISKNSFKRTAALDLLSWIAYKYGFGTYLHRIEGYYSKATVEQAENELKKLIKLMNREHNFVFIDTIISPSYTSAIAQAIQVHGITGMENNMVIFEYNKDNINELEAIIDNINMVSAGRFDICILASGERRTIFSEGIHVWIRSIDTDNSNLMILLSFIISGHPDWRSSSIKIFDICKPEQIEETKLKMKELVTSGRLPITESNIEIIEEQENVSAKTLIKQHSEQAGLTLIGFRKETLSHEKEKFFEDFEQMGNILFVMSQDQKELS